MLKIIERIAEGVPSVSLTLPLEKRLKARLRVILDDGREAGLLLERGPILRGGQLLRGEEGCVVEVVAAEETVTVVEVDDPTLFARLCYHLGNRHVPLQILPGEVRYQPDHVLDQIVERLGLEPQMATYPFEPEPGAFGEHGSDHVHGHSH